MKSWRWADALRESIADSYQRKDFFSDLQSGVIVGIVAIPLGMALAIASGVPPQYGLYTVLIAGAVTALLGGSRFQITGPTAAFVVLLLPVVQQFGFGGLLTAGFIAGFLQLLMGLSGLGRMIQYVPHPVTTGFTSGIAVVIASLQIKDFLGLSFEGTPSGFLAIWTQILSRLSTLQADEIFVGLSTLLLIVFVLKFFKRLPAPVVALFSISLLVYLLQRFSQDIQISTIATRFSFFDGGRELQGIPQGLPSWNWPWAFTTEGGLSFQLNTQMIREIFPFALAISALGAIESLLSAVVADGMTQRKHNPNSELVALGVANMICPFFGGIPATGAIARTTTNIRFGARSPIAALIHSMVILVVLLGLAPLMGFIPMASLAALLLFVAWNMSERHHFMNILKIGDKEDKAVLLTCFLLTVFFDMTIGVGVGMVLAGLLFIKRVADQTEAETLQDLTQEEEIPLPQLPSHILFYRIRGSLFFGAAHEAMASLNRITNQFSTLILDLRKVHLIDSTGLVALTSALQAQIFRKRKVIVLSDHRGLRDQVLKLDILKKNSDSISVVSRLKDAVDRAHEMG
jgi:SulP family sulfate permease